MFSHVLPDRSAQIASTVFALHPIQAETVANGSGLAVQFSVISTFAAALFALRRKPDLSAKPAAPLFLCAAFLPVLLVAGGIPARGFDWLSQQGIAILRTLSLLLVPVGFTAYPDLAAGPIALSLAWGVIAALLMLAATSKPEASTGWWLVAAIGALAGSSWLLGSTPAGSDQAVYLATFFLAGLAGILLQAVGRRALLAFALLLGLLTVDRAKVWRSEQAVWMEASRLAPHAVQPKLKLARTLPPAQALEVLQSALEDSPGNPEVLAAIAELQLPVSPETNSSVK